MSPVAGVAPMKRRNIIALKAARQRVVARRGNIDPAPKMAWLARNRNEICYRGGAECRVAGIVDAVSAACVSGDFRGAHENRHRKKLMPESLASA